MNEVIFKDLFTTIDDQDNFIVVGIVDGEIVSTCAVNDIRDGYATIQFLFVREENRRNGIAKSMIDYVKGVCAGLGHVSRINLWVKKGNPALSLYLKSGFEIITASETDDYMSVAVKPSRESIPDRPEPPRAGER